MASFYAYGVTELVCNSFCILLYCLQFHGEQNCDFTHTGCSRAYWTNCRPIVSNTFMTNNNVLKKIYWRVYNNLNFQTFSYTIITDPKNKIGDLIYLSMEWPTQLFWCRNFGKMGWKINDPIYAFHQSTVCLDSLTSVIAWW